MNVLVWMIFYVLCFGGLGGVLSRLLSYLPHIIVDRWSLDRGYITGYNMLLVMISSCYGHATSMYDVCNSLMRGDQQQSKLKQACDSKQHFSEHRQNMPKPISDLQYQRVTKALCRVMANSSMSDAEVIAIADVMLRVMFSTFLQTQVLNSGRAAHEGRQSSMGEDEHDAVHQSVSTSAARSTPVWATMEG